MYPVWDAGLERVKDKHLYKAILNVCMKKHQYPPTLGHVLEEVKDVIRELGGTGMELKEYKFCDDCVQREGIREISGSLSGGGNRSGEDTQLRSSVHL